MSCNCNQHLAEMPPPPTGIKAIWSEHQVPICITGAVILGTIGYGVYKKKSKKKTRLSDLAGRRRRKRSRLSDNVLVIDRKYKGGKVIPDKYYFSNSQLKMYDKKPNTNYYIAVASSDTTHPLELLQKAKPISQVADLSGSKRKRKR